MINTELALQPAWRYCNVTAGDKRPYPAGWQNRPRTLDAITSSNVGLLLGVPSSGVCALDFDGTTAWRWYDHAIGAALPATATWRSGKTDRCQMAFAVPEQYWNYLRTLKITHTRDPIIDQGEGFEFRWTGTQSVMPPSELADGRQYTWLQTPEQVATIPEEILCYWLQHSNPNVPATEPRDLTQLGPADLQEITMLLTRVKTAHADLDYDTWRTVAWAVAHHLGVGVAQQVMPMYWPERQRNEYAHLYRGYNPARSPTIGTIRHLAMPKISVRAENRQRYQTYQQELAELNQLEQAIKQRKQKCQKLV
jgi:hypothetical protein